MRTRAIGDREVGAIGLGEMQLSLADRPDEARGVATIHAALDAGITLIDTADAYCADGSEMGHGERLTATALKAYGNTDHVLVATKGGHVRDLKGGWLTDGSPAYLRQACDASLTALGVEAIGLYQHHRPDPEVPYGETDFRSSLDELRLCAELGLAFLPWSPLGGAGKASESAGTAFTEVAAEHGVSPQQVALAWTLAESPTVIPIPGSSRPETILDSAAAADLELTADQLARLR